MSNAPGGHGAEVYGIDEVEIRLHIEEGKITAESQTGPKSGRIRLGVDDRTVSLVLEGAGSDRAVATLSGPELANFRTIVDAGLSAALADDDASDLDSRVLSSDYRPLRRYGDDLGVALDTDALRRLGLVSESGEIPGGNRQVQCTVLGTGTAILNLTGDDETRFDF